MTTGSLSPSHPDLPRLDSSAIWWREDASPAAASASWLPLWPPARRPRVTASVALFLASLLFTPLAAGCWLLAHEELRGMDEGSVEDESRGWFGFLRLWGQCWSCMVLAAILFALTILSFGLG